MIDSIGVSKLNQLILVFAAHSPSLVLPGRAVLSSLLLLLSSTLSSTLVLSGSAALCSLLAFFAVLSSFYNSQVELYLFTPPTNVCTSFLIPCILWPCSSLLSPLTRVNYSLSYLAPSKIPICSLNCHSLSDSCSCYVALHNSPSPSLSL